MLLKIKSKIINGLSLLIILTIGYSCTNECNPYSSNHNSSNNTIQGSGNLVSEIREFSSFNSVHMTTAGQVLLTQGDSQKVKVTVDDNLLQHVSLTEENNVLTIAVESGYSLNNMQLTIEISLPHLRELHTSSAGNFIGQNLFICDELNLFSSSAGNIYLNLQANYLYTYLSSAGNASLSGAVPVHDAIISSAGGLHSFNLITDTTTISLSSAGNAEIYVNDLLNATLSSAGSLFYKGNPVIHASVSSAGIIVDAN